MATTCTLFSKSLCPLLKSLIPIWSSVSILLCMTGIMLIYAVASGFDAAVGDELGGCFVTPSCYAHMTHMLMGLANGKVSVCLEVCPSYHD